MNSNSHCRITTTLLRDVTVAFVFFVLLCVVMASSLWLPLIQGAVLQLYGLVACTIIAGMLIDRFAFGAFAIALFWLCAAAADWYSSQASIVDIAVTAPLLSVVHCVLFFAAWRFGLSIKRYANNMNGVRSG